MWGNWVGFRKTERTGGESGQPPGGLESATAQLQTNKKSLGGEVPLKGKEKATPASSYRQLKITTTPASIKGQKEGRKTMGIESLTGP